MTRPTMPNKQTEPVAPVDEEFVPRRARSKQTGKVLLGAVLFVIIAASLQHLSPWFLPPYLYEGPLVQMASGTEVTLIWYMSRESDVSPAVTVKGLDTPLTVAMDHQRCRCRITA